MPNSYDEFLKQISIPSKSNIHIKRRKDERLELTFTIPVHRHDEITECPITLILAREDVAKLAWAHRALLGAAMQLKCARAELELLAEENPPPLKRKSNAALTKFHASEEAKRIHPIIKYLYRHPDDQSEYFRQMIAAVEATLGDIQTITEITAWLIERQYEQIWDIRGLRRPTKNAALFAKDYLYTKPHMTKCTPETLPDLAWYLDRLIQKLLPR